MVIYTLNKHRRRCGNDDQCYYDEDTKSRVALLKGHCVILPDFVDAADEDRVKKS